MSTTALRRLLLRTATSKQVGAVRSLASISSSTIAARGASLPSQSENKNRNEIASSQASCKSKRSFSIAAATSVSMEDADTATSSSLDSLLDPSTPTPLFGFTTTAELPAVVRTNKFLKCGISENVLRFKTMSYGRLLNAPFVHPNEHRVILMVSLDALPLTTQLEHDILEEIVGARYNRERNELRLQSVQFASRIENKRHLVSMLDRLVLSCQSLAKEVGEDKQEKEEVL